MNYRLIQRNTYAPCILNLPYHFIIRQLPPHLPIIRPREPPRNSPNLLTALASRSHRLSCIKRVTHELTHLRILANVAGHHAHLDPAVHVHVAVGGCHHEEPRPTGNHLVGLAHVVAQQLIHQCLDERQELLHQRFLCILQQVALVEECLDALDEHLLLSFLAQRRIVAPVGVAWVSHPHQPIEIGVGDILIEHRLPVGIHRGKVWRQTHDGGTLVHQLMHHDASDGRSLACVKIGANHVVVSHKSSAVGEDTLGEVRPF